MFRAATEIHVFIVILTALILKNDLRWEILKIGAYDYILFVSFIVLVPTAGLLAIISKLRHVQKLLKLERDTVGAVEARRRSFDLQALGLADSADKADLRRYVEGWAVKKTYAAFLSHFKDQAAAEARILKTELVTSLRAREDQVFLDSDDLSDLRDLLTAVQESDAMVLLYTKGVLQRPWCLLELQAAVNHNVPIVLLKVANIHAGDTDEIPAIVGDLENYLKDAHPMAEETLVSQGTSSQQVSAVIKDALCTAEVITFDPYQSAAMLRASVAQLAAQLVEHACPDNAPLLPDIEEQREAEEWPVQRKYAVYIVHEEQTPAVVAVAQEVRAWLLRNTELLPSQIVTQVEHLNCHDREINDAKASDLESIANEADCVLLIQSTYVLHEPRSLALLFAAAENVVPIVPAVLMPSKDEDKALLYDFAAVKPTLENLAARIDAEAIACLEKATHSKSQHVGLALSGLLPNIISKPLPTDTQSGDFGVKMVEIERALRRTTQADTGQDTPRSQRNSRNSRNRNLTRDRVEQLRTAFRRMDANGDGSISKGEIMQALARDSSIGELLGLHALTGDELFFEAGVMFQDMDTDRGGDVDIDEFVAFFGKPDRPTQKLSVHQVEQLHTAFGRLDMDGDGAISKEEILSALAQDEDLGELLGMSVELTAEERFFQAGVIFQDMDTDRGGDVDVDEFVAFFGVASDEEAAQPPRLIPETSADAGGEISHATVELT